MNEKKRLLSGMPRAVTLTVILMLCLLLAAGTVQAAEMVTIHVDELHRDVEVERDGISILQDREIRNRDDAKEMDGQPFRETLVIGVPEGTSSIWYEINDDKPNDDYDPGTFSEIIEPQGGTKAVALIYQTEELAYTLRECPLHIEYMDAEGEVIAELDAAIWWSESLADNYTLEGGEWIEEDWESEEAEDGFGSFLLTALVLLCIVVPGVRALITKGNVSEDGDEDEEPEPSGESPETFGGADASSDKPSEEPEWSLFRRSEEDSAKADEPGSGDRLKEWFKKVEQRRKSSEMDPYDSSDYMENPFEVGGHRKRKKYNPFEK